jgi:hypothetical protein
MKSFIASQEKLAASFPRKTAFLSFYPLFTEKTPSISLSKSTYPQADYRAKKVPDF